MKEGRSDRPISWRSLVSMPPRVFQRVCVNQKVASQFSYNYVTPDIFPSNLLITELCVESQNRTWLVVPTPTNLAVAIESINGICVAAEKPPKFLFFKHCAAG